jgi:hypothetical protein
MTKSEVEELSTKIEKSVYFIFGILVLLSIYGVYSLFDRYL